MQALLTSLIVEGVFEHFPDLKIVLIEGGFAWAPPLAWRLDAQWKRLKSEAPHLRRLPSEYIRDQVWFTTQPIEEPERPDDLLAVMDWLGWDRILISTDYPHWDFDDPRTAFRVPLTHEQRRMVFRDNAFALYDLDWVARR
jgi:predicted TIM-barrel fold metal-dependent hydrolase